LTEDGSTIAPSGGDAPADQRPAGRDEGSSGLGVAEGQPPVFLIGPARSGTSLLYKVLCLHPDVSYVSNWVARFPGRWWLASFNRVARRFPSQTRRVWFGGGSNAYVYGRARPLRERLFPMPVEGEPVYAACGVHEAGDPDVNVGNEALRTAFAAIQHSSGGSLFVNKRVANNLRIPLLARTFPSARFVWITRDGRAVANSLSRVDWWDNSLVWWCGQTPRRWREEGRDPWELCARNWVEELSAIEDGIRSVPGENVFRLSYEDFVRDPMAALSEMAGFLGLPPSEEWWRLVRALRYPDRNEAWKDALDERAVNTITEIQAAKLKDYGYAA
jgi:hypothetical protein